MRYRITVRVLGTALGLFATGVTPTLAFSPVGMLRNAAPPSLSGPHLVAKREALPPFGFASFCVASSDQCESTGTKTTVALTREKRIFLQTVNVEVNRDIVYSDDESDTDDWKLVSNRGDCEDYALTKRQRLLAAGWPSGALRIATARTAEGIGHAVLVVSTTNGDLVLDNRTNVTKPWYATGLRWIKIQSAEDPRKWQAL